MQIKLDIERRSKKMENAALSILELQKDISNSIHQIVKEKFADDLHCIKDLSINYNGKEKCIVMYKTYSNYDSDLGMKLSKFFVGYKIDIDNLIFYPYVEIAETLL